MTFIDMADGFKDDLRYVPYVSVRILMRDFKLIPVIGT